MGSAEGVGGQSGSGRLPEFELVGAVVKPSQTKLAESLHENDQAPE